MINWKDHKAALTGASKYLIKGVFRFVHSVTSDSLEPIESVVCFPGVLKDLELNGTLKNIEFNGILVDQVFNGILNAEPNFNGILKDINHPGTLVEIEFDGIIRTDC